jgi:hypothetical protein
LGIPDRARRDSSNRFRDVSTLSCRRGILLDSHRAVSKRFPLVTRDCSKWEPFRLRVSRRSLGLHKLLPAICVARGIRHRRLRFLSACKFRKRRSCGQDHDSARCFRHYACWVFGSRCAERRIISGRGNRSIYRSRWRQAITSCFRAGIALSPTRSTC